MTLFDAYVIVDWSASSKPKQGADSVWIAAGEWHAAELRSQPSRNPSTRFEATAALMEMLERLVAQGRRVLVGFDFPYGYPQGLGAGLRGTGALSNGETDWDLTWHRLAACICDRPDNTNNRFEAAAALNAGLAGKAGPFWGCPVGRESPRLGATSPSFPVVTGDATALSRYRETETRLRSRGSQVQETWKLFGNGSVGSQALLGIPRVAGLRWAPSLKQASAVWPFETGFTSRPGEGRRPFVLHAEIWPGVLPRTKRQGGIKDQLQVEGLIEFLARKDTEDELGALFDTPAGLTDVASEACIREEGWILAA